MRPKALGTRRGASCRVYGCYLSRSFRRVYRVHMISLKSQVRGPNFFCHNSWVFCRSTRKKNSMSANCQHMCRRIDRPQNGKYLLFISSTAPSCTATTTGCSQLAKRLHSSALPGNRHYSTGTIILLPLNGIRRIVNKCILHSC